MKERLIQFLAYIGLGQSKFEEKVGLSRGMINKIGDNITIKSLNKIIAVYPELNINWLKTGEGEMLKGAKIATSICDGQQTYRVIPIYNLDAVGGKVNGEVDIAEYKIGEMPFVDAKEGDICVPVSGKSMLPTYPAGTFVQLRVVERWKEYTELGQTYVLVLKDGRRLIKELRCSEEDKKNNFILFSHNPNFAPQEIPKELILRIYLVVSSYTKTVM